MIFIYKEIEKYLLHTKKQTLEKVFLAMFLFKYFDTIQISCKIFFAPL